MMELLATTPGSELKQNGVRKAQLRRSMRGIVPDKILDRRDKGTINSYTHDLLIKNRNLFDAAVNDISFKSMHLVDVDKLNRL